MPANKRVVVIEGEDAAPEAMRPTVELRRQGVAQIAAEEATADAGVALSCNLTGSIWVNQSAAFSDFHGTGANPAGNATLCDTVFVAGRFRVVQSRSLVPQPATV